MLSAVISGGFVRKQSVSFYLVLVLVILTSGVVTRGQDVVPSVAIKVTDPSGAPIPHARLELSPLPEPVRRTLETGEEGSLTLTIPPGTYTLSVSSQGFRTWTKQVQVADTPAQTVQVMLSVGGCPPGCPVEVSTVSHFNGQTWWNHVKVLADDKMEGRETGSRGEHAAEEYAIEQFKSAGVEPAGTNGFFQPVKFVSRQMVEKDCRLALVHDGKRKPLSLGEDAFILSRIAPAPRVAADLVFVGYGLNIPEKNYNDFDGLDLKGKIAVIFSGSPTEIPGALASHSQTTAERWKTLKAQGAVGVVMIPNPAAMDIPWSRIMLNRNRPTMDLDYPEFDETAGEQLAMYMNPAHADRLFAGSGHSFEKIAALGKERKPLPRFPLAVSLEASTEIETTQVESANVIGKLEGNDPVLKNEYVVLSAHIDHLGIGEPIKGDRIYNGAMDNGSGSALLLDMAASLKSHPESLRRSVLFVLVTGEEKGLLGSKYFAAHPTVPMHAMIADINVDMFLPIIPLKVITVFGLAESDLGDRARDVAQGLGLPVQPDPEPQRNVFIRSDQYNFIRHGIPAVMPEVGFNPGSPEQDIFKAWLTNRYHAPSDDLQQPVNLDTAAKYEEVVRGLLINVANDDHRPQWKPDSFFKRYAEQ